MPGIFDTLKKNKLVLENRILLKKLGGNDATG